MYTSSTIDNNNNNNILIINNNKFGNMKWSGHSATNSYLILSNSARSRTYITYNFIHCKVANNTKKIYNSGK